MQVIERKWSWKDAPGAISMALSPTRLLIGVAGILVVEVLAWLLGKVWEPAISSDFLIGLRVLVLAAIVLYVLYATVAVIGRSVYLELEEGEGLGLGGSLAFLFTTGIRTGFAPLLLLGLLAVMWVLAVVGFLLGRLWMGLGAIMFLPMMIFIMLGGLAGLLAFYGVYIAAGSAGVRKSGALDTTLDTLDMLRGRGVFWGFVVTLIVMGIISVILNVFYMLGQSAISAGAGSAPLQAVKMTTLSAEWLGSLYSGTGLAQTAEGIADWMWVFAIKVFELLCKSFLLCTFAGSGVIGYLVGSEGEVVVVEEKKAVEKQIAVKEEPKTAEVKKETETKPAAEKKEPAGESAEGKKPTTQQHPAVKKRPHGRKESDEEEGK